jgi:purine-binding chemotaxis protein CheW
MKSLKNSDRQGNASMLSTSTASQSQTPQTKEEIKQYLTFWLNEQEYGLDLLRVREIRGFTAITAIPNMPSHIKGVMNLRGTVLPVVDLRLKFGMPEKPYTKFTVIIIAKSGEKNIGLVVDSVSDVLSLPAHQISPPPDFGIAVDRNFILGLLKASDRLSILLDLDKLLSESEVTVDAAADKTVH